MVGFRRMLIAVALGMGIVSLSTEAQPASSSLTHTVTVTVPPRVKVQVAALSASPSLLSVSNAKESTQGVALTVNATRTWILSIGTAHTSAPANSNIKWSLNSAAGFSSLSSEVVIASGSLSNAPAAAGIYFRTAAKDSTTGTNQAPVVFTISAP